MKTVLIGLGMVASTHLAALRDNHAGVVLAGVLGRDKSRADQFAQKASAEIGQTVRVYTSAQEVAQDPEIDFVIIATPPNARLDILKPLVAAGKPILMEKPIERDLPRSAEIVALCEKASVPLGLFFQLRMRRAAMALSQKIEAGILGDLVSTNIRVPWWRDQSYYDEPGRGTYDRDGGGVMISQAIHTLDLALSFLGPVDRLQATMQTTPLHQMEAEDWAAALLHFKSGAVGNLFATTAAFPGAAETISIQGTKAAAHLESGILTINHLSGETEVIGAKAATGGGADPMAFKHDWHQRIIEDFVQAIQTNRPTAATGADGLRAQAVITAMEQSAKSNSSVKVEQI